MLPGFVEVGAGHWRRFSSSGFVDVDVLRIAREQAFERDAVHYGRARPFALRIRLHWRERILDLLCSTVLVVGVAMFSSTLFLFGTGARVDVRQIHHPRTWQ